MVYVKTAIFTVIAILCLLAGYIFFTFDTDYGVNVAYDAFLKGDYPTALKDLSKLNESVSPDRASLYQAYIFREMRDLDKSNEALEKAVFQSRKHNQPLLSLEIYLNQALNGYLSKRDSLLQSALANAQRIDAGNAWVVFFQALVAFQAGDYATARELWEMPNSRLPLSGWMKKAFDEVFTPRWLTLHIARCQIETGEFLVARQALEQQVEGASTDELNDINFLIGLSYAKEAEGKPPAAAAPYYKLAISYLNRVPMQQERFAAERQRLLSNMQKVVQQLIVARSLNDLPFYASIMQAWSAQDELNHLIQQLTDLLDTDLEAGRWNQMKEITGLLNRLIPDGEARQKLENRFQALAKTALETGSLEHASSYWEAATLFSNHPDQLAQAFSDESLLQAEKNIDKDDENLTATKPYVDFLLTVQKDPAERLRDANRLVEIADKLWQQPEQRTKALALMRMALSLAGNENLVAVKSSIEKPVSSLYSEAMAKDDLDQLPLLLDAVRAFDLKNIDIQRDQEIHKQLIAVKKAVQQNDYDQAMKRVRWVLRLDPQNAVAKMYAGEVLFQQGDYDAAVTYLSEIPSPTLDQLEALAIAKTLTGNAPAGQQLMAQLERKRPLSQDAIFRLGVGYLLLDQPKKALEWLQKLPSPTSEVILALAYSDLLQRDFQGNLTDLGMLQAPFNDLDIVKGMMIQSKIGLGDEVGAEKSLQELMDSPEQPIATTTLSLPFRVLAEKRLSEFNRYFVAGLYQKEVKRDFTAALKYFREIEDPTPHVRVIISDILSSLGRYSEAVSLLKDTLKGNAPDALKLQALPLLAIAQSHLGDDVGAYQAFKAYFDLDASNLAYRGAFAEILMSVHRYDLAVEQYRLLKEKGTLTPADAIGFVKSLVYTANPSDAIEEASKWLKSEDMPSLTQQLELARWMVVAGYSEGSWDMLKKLPENDKLTTEQATALMQFYMQLGAYEQAVAVLNAKNEALQETAAGLMTLADLTDRFSDSTQSMQLAQRALKLQPDNRSIMEFISQHTTDVSFLEEAAKEAAQKMETDPDNITKRLDYAQQVAYLGKVATLTPGVGFARYQQEAQRTLFVMAKTAKALPELPEPMFLKGAMEMLLKQFDNAETSFYEALKLDAAYKDVNLWLASLAFSVKDEKKAIKSLFQVVRYYPDDARAWQALAQLFTSQGYLFEATNFFEYAIKFAPNDLNNYISLAKVFLELRNPEDARRVLGAAANAAPNNVEVLKLLLTTLYDSALQTTVDDPKALSHDQAEAYNKLHQLDAQAAEEILKQVGQQTPPGDFEYPPLDSPLQINSPIRS